MSVLTNNQHIGKYEVKRLIKESLYCETYRVEDESEEPFFLKIFVLKDALGENGVMYYLKDAKADFFKMMELVETITF